MSAGLKALADDGIDTGFLTLPGKFRGRNDVCHGDAVFFQERRPGLRIPGGGKDNFHAFVHNQMHQFLYLRIHQRDVYAKRLVGCLAAFLDMLAERFRMHGTRPNQTQTAGVTDGRSQTPTATPNHTARNNRVLYPKQ